jgi:hypothetical protein
MSTTAIIVSGILGWILVAILTAVVVGKIIRLRERHRSIDAGPGVTDGNDHTCPEDRSALEGSGR